METTQTITTEQTCQCPSCTKDGPHKSDCAVHNEPSSANAKCDCGTSAQKKPIIYLDASALKDASCGRRLIYTIFYGFSKDGSASKYQSYKTGYGSAFHKALEYWYGSDEKDVSKAIALATDYYAPFTPHIPERPTEFRTISHLTQSVQAYLNYYKHGDELANNIGDIKPESRFVIPWYSCADFELVLTGTMDRFAYYYGEECLIDHKSTAAYGAASDYFRGYELSVQMMFYSWVLQRLVGRRLPVIINGIFIRKPTAKIIEEGGFDGVTFHRSNKITFTDQQMGEFEVWLKEKILFVVDWLKFYFTHSSDLELGIPKPPANFSACTNNKFPQDGLCPYFSACALPQPTQDQLLNSMDRVKYSPLHFGE